MNLFKYGSQVLSLDDWKATYNLELHRYRDMLSKENYLKQALLNDGLTSEQVDKIISDGKYIKVFPGDKKKK